MSTRRAYFWLMVTLISFGLIWILRDVLAPFLTGMAIAYLVNPGVTALSKRIPRNLASLLVLVGFIFIVVGVLTVFSPMIGRQAVEFFNNVPNYLTKLQEW